MDNVTKIIMGLKELILTAVKTKLAPVKNEKLGILFSGGIDSTLIAFILKTLGAKFTCYTMGVEEGNLKEAEDVTWAKKVALKLGFDLEIIKLDLTAGEKLIRQTTKLLATMDNKVVHVGVGAVMLAVCEKAKKDNISRLFSGLGSEELFAGYDRHAKSQDINEECKKGLAAMKTGDLLRDRLISENQEVNFITPFLDERLIRFSQTIPGELKIKDDIKKYILRLAAQDLGIPKDIAFRKKRAAQYGSNVDKIIAKLAKKNNFAYKHEYINSMIKLGALVSGGKDSLFAMYKMIKQGYKIECLINVKSQNPDSYMFHTPNADLVKHQSIALDLPMAYIETKGEKEKELADLKKVIKEAKAQCKLDGIITGALFSNYQRERIEKICKELNMACFSPLWHTDQEELLKELIKEKFKVIITAIAADGLTKDYLGVLIDDDFIAKMVKLNKKIGINIAAEGGEYESLVIDCPMFKKSLEIIKADKVMENTCTGKLVIKEAKLINK